jgi:hypothetical protein
MLQQKDRGAPRFIPATRTNNNRSSETIVIVILRKPRLRAAVSKDDGGVC